MKVLVVIARGLQAGALSCYGNSWIEAPNLDFLASQGVVFDRHFADAVEADAVRRVWRSGRYHLPPMTEQAAPSADQPADVIAALRSCGIYTYLIRDESQSGPLVFEEGWDEMKRIAPPAPDSLDTSLVSTLDAVRDALKQLENRPDWLLWVEVATPLPPWDLPDEFREPYFASVQVEDDEDHGEIAADDEDGEIGEPFVEVVAGPIDLRDDTLFLRLQSSYAAAVSYFDAGIGHLLEDLGDLADDLLLLITADSGQALGEHGIVGPVRPWLHDEMVHVPLLMRLPGGAEAGRRVSALTQPVDLAPTLADVFETPLPGAHGHSLVPLMQGDAVAVRDFACSGWSVGVESEWSLRALEWAFLLPAPIEDTAPRAAQLYVKPDDRWEVNNVVQHQPELAEQLERTLREFVTATLQPGSLLLGQTFADS